MRKTWLQMPLTEKKNTGWLRVKQSVCLSCRQHDSRNPHSAESANHTQCMFRWQVSVKHSWGFSLWGFFLFLNVLWLHCLLLNQHSAPHDSPVSPTAALLLHRQFNCGSELLSRGSKQRVLHYVSFSICYPFLSLWESAIFDRNCQRMSQIKH